MKGEKQKKTDERAALRKENNKITENKDSITINMSNAIY